MSVDQTSSLTIRERALLAARAACGNSASLPTPPEPGFSPEGAAVGGGLVYTSTSDTRPSEFIVDPHLSRLRRLKRSVITSARLIQEEVDSDPSERFHAVMVTLTYRQDSDWCPYQITQYIKAVRAWFLRRGSLIRYLWVHELTKAGKTHYHVLFWLPKRLQMPKADKRGWWPHGMTKTEKVKRNAVGYVAKYASKGSDDSVPKGARLCGSGGLSGDARAERAWWLCPGYVRAWCPDYADRPRRAQGGGWVAKGSGDYLPAQFQVVRRWPLTVRRIMETVEAGEF